MQNDGIRLKKCYFHHDFSLKKVNFHNQYAKVLATPDDEPQCVYFCKQSSQY
jgi:hypothetical protein